MLHPPLRLLRLLCLYRFSLWVSTFPIWVVVVRVPHLAVPKRSGTAPSTAGNRAAPISLIDHRSNPQMFPSPPQLLDPADGYECIVRPQKYSKTTGTKTKLTGIVSGKYPYKNFIQQHFLPLLDEQLRLIQRKIIALLLNFAHRKFGTNTRTQKAQVRPNGL